MSSYQLSIVIPVYNEEDNIEAVVEDVFSCFPLCELIIVDDASTDKTLDILVKLSKKYKNLTVYFNVINRGHGFSVIKGLGQATGDYTLYIDADRQIGLENFYLTNFEFISGYRKGRHDKLFRKVISFMLKTTNLIRHQYYIKDANCPFKIYKTDALRVLLPQVPQSYIVPIACLEVLARRNGISTLTIPVIHKKYHTERMGKLQSINRTSLKFFWDAFWEIVKL